MILSTCGASAVVLHTTSLFWRAAWARRTSHQGAVVARTATVLPACCKMSRRVSIFYLPSPLHDPAPTPPPDAAHRSPPPSCVPLPPPSQPPSPPPAHGAACGRPCRWRAPHLR